MMTEQSNRPFAVVCAMEDALEDLRAIMLTLDLVSMGMAEDDNGDHVAIAYLAKQLRDKAAALSEHRRELFGLLQPSRTKPEAEQ